MPASTTHALDFNQEVIVTQRPGESLALVDPETYPSFIGAKADRLDLMAHLHDQALALSAFSWLVKNRAIKLRVVVTGDHRAMERLTFSNRPPSASGTLRTFGRLCLVGHDRLLDCARHRKYTLFTGGDIPRGGRPQLFQVPSGIYYALVYYHFPYPDGARPGYTRNSDRETDYTVFLHHYPHPPPRVAPVRLHSNFLSQLDGAESAITSHYPRPT
ncbi:MAG: hypothetical protein LV479_08225 [Methylacidiphilales bacterium]|nr:hypothetical protein [Candidatus Methylacidiphilales bacterium]